ncbi:MAG: toll/interleukin-1 receptor domain-containing protein [Acidobacteriota bacterium]
MHVFLSYSAEDRGFAKRLGDELARQGVSIWLDQDQLVPGRPWREEMEKAIRSCDDILILVGPHDTDTWQQHTWREALEAAWQDPRKRLIPILLEGAAVPPFVYGDAAGKDAPLVQILNPQDPRGAADAIVHALRRETPRATGVKTDAAEVGTKGSQSYAVEASRSRRLEELERFAQGLKK